MAMRQGLVRLFGSVGTPLGTYNVEGLTRRDDIVLTIPKNVNLKKFPRLILSMPPGSKPTGGGQKVGRPKQEGGFQTPIDMDAGPILASDGTYCRVRVFCRDKDIRFAEGPFAITAADTEGAAMFFNLTHDEPVEHDPIVSFDCVRPAKPEGPDTRPVIGAFNIGLVIDDDPFDLPIIIDPKIQNRG